MRRVILLNARPVIEILTPTSSTADHILRNTRFLYKQSNDLLDDQLICKPSPKAHGGERIHDELRRRLLSWPEAKIVIQEYTTIIVSSLIAAGISGVITGLGASYNLYLKNPGNSMDNPPDVRLAPLLPFNNSASNQDVINICYHAERTLDEASEWAKRVGHLTPSEVDKYFGALTRYFRYHDINPPHVTSDPKERFPEHLRFLEDLQKIALRGEYRGYRDFPWSIGDNEYYNLVRERDLYCELSEAMQKLAINTHNDEVRKYKIAKLQARNTGIISAITTFCASISASIIVDLSTRRRMQYADAFPSAIYISMMRRAIKDWTKKRAQESQRTLTSITGPTATSGSVSASYSPPSFVTSSALTSSSSALPSDAPLDSPSCVSEDEALELMHRLSGFRSSTDDVAEVLSDNHRDLEMAILNQRGARDHCLVSESSMFVF